MSICRVGVCSVTWLQACSYCSPSRSRATDANSFNLWTCACLRESGTCISKYPTGCSACFQHRIWSLHKAEMSGAGTDAERLRCQTRVTYQTVLSLIISDELNTVEQPQQKTSAIKLMRFVSWSVTSCVQSPNLNL